MFKATETYSDVDCDEISRCVSVSLQCDVKTTSGWVNSKHIKVGDTLITKVDDRHCEIIVTKILESTDCLTYFYDYKEVVK